MPSDVSHSADIDECARRTDDCGANSDCINTDGSFECVCRTGFEKISGTEVCRGVQVYQDLKTGFHLAFMIS